MGQQRVVPENLPAMANSTIPMEDLEGLNAENKCVCGDSVERQGQAKLTVNCVAGGRQSTVQRTLFEIAAHTATGRTPQRPSREVANQKQ
eukprot:c29990_g1_i1 orf=3-269(-)